jgi:hypothetical protein
LCAPAAAAPTQVTLQGTLQDADGAPMTGTRAYTVQFFDMETGGSQLSTLLTGETVLSPTGRWAIALTPPSTVMSSSAVWYELGIDSAETPDGVVDAATDVFPGRFQVHSVLFARRSADTEAVGGIAANQFVTLTQLAVSLNTKANVTHHHDSAYSPLSHNHNSVYSLLTHNHDSAYAALNHRIHGTDTTAVGLHAGAGGGYGNRAAGDFSFVGGGEDNSATASHSVVGGGDYNTAEAASATIAGGNTNSVSGVNGTVGGGLSNTLVGEGAAIAGGEGNWANGPHSFIGGGEGNWTGNSLDPLAGSHAAIPGGIFNFAVGRGTLAAGSYAHANHDGAFVWSDSQGSGGNIFDSQRVNQFRARAGGGVDFQVAGAGLNPPGLNVTATGATAVGMHIQTNSSDANTVLTNTGSGSTLKLYGGGDRDFEVYGNGNAWLRGTLTQGSDRTMKTNILPVDPRVVLERVATVPVSTWSYTADPDTVHMGPMAQDLHAAFGLGGSDTSIAVIDADGVSLAAIQGLYQLVQQQQATIDQLQREVDALRRDAANQNRRSPQ